MSTTSFERIGVDSLVNYQRQEHQGMIKTRAHSTSKSHVSSGYLKVKVDVTSLKLYAPNAFPAETTKFDRFLRQYRKFPGGLFVLWL